MQKTQFLFIISLIFAIIVSIFALTNGNPVVINLLFYSFEASQALVIFASAALGAFVVFFMGTVNHIKLKGQIRNLKKAKDELEDRFKNLSIELEALKLQGEMKSLQERDSIKEANINDK